VLGVVSTASTVDDVHSARYNIVVGHSLDVDGVHGGGEVTDGKIKHTVRCRQVE